MGRKLASGSSAQGIFVEAFDAEAAALTGGLWTALAHPLAGKAHSLWACLNNARVVMAVYSRPRGSSQQALLEATKLLDSWKHRSRPDSFDQLP